MDLEGGGGSLSRAGDARGIKVAAVSWGLKEVHVGGTAWAEARRLVRGLGPEASGPRSLREAVAKPDPQPR